MGIDFHRGQSQLFVGLYEVEINRHLRAIAKPGYRSFDIGGCFGYDALILAKLTKGPVVTVEAESALSDEIRENADANPQLGPIYVETAFVGDTNDNGSITIDSLAEAHYVPDLIKIDIEGAETAALRGAGGVLKEHRPAVFLEVHGSDIEWDCLALMREAGYDPPTVVDRRRWMREHRPLEHNRWLVFAATTSPPAHTP